MRSRKFNYSDAVLGCRLVLWGFFKKVLIADTCAVLVDEIFLNYWSQAGWTLIAGVVFFAFQLYGDFSGYSNIARVSQWHSFNFDSLPEAIRWESYQAVASVLVWFLFYRNPNEFLNFKF